MTTDRYLLVVSRCGVLTTNLIRRLAAEVELRSTSAGNPRWAVFTSNLHGGVDGMSQAGAGREGRGVTQAADDAAPSTLPSGIAIATTEATVSIARDPSGAAPCCWTETPELMLVASDPALLAATGLWRPKVDWDGLAATLSASGVPAERTGLHGCQELLPGFCLHISRAGEWGAEPYWSPWSFVARSRLKGAQGDEELRAIVTHAANAAARPYRRVLVGVSGGLDSSIVAAALVNGGRPITCFTIATEATDGDERCYARLLARHLGAELIEARYDLDDIDLDRSISAELPRPAARSHEQSYYLHARAALRASGSDAFFTGNGGDAIFCTTRSAVALTDRLLASGLRRAAMRTMIDICRLTGASPAAVIRRSTRKLARSQRGYRVGGDPLFLTPARRADLAAAPPRHPWLDAPSGALPGRAVHIAMVLRIQQALANHRSFPVIHPLAARTVLEAAFAIPTWRWVEHGVDRAVARRAFADQLPPAILARRVKGTPDSFAIALIERRRDEIASRLLEGRLATHGIICRAAVEEALRRFGPGQPLHHVRLLQLLEAENWAAHWTR